MSKFTDNLTAQRKKLGMSVVDVAAALDKRGVHRSESTVAQWLNGTRGVRMDVDDLRALLDVLETTFEAMNNVAADPDKVRFMQGLVQDIMELTPESQKMAKRLIHSLKDEP